MTHQISLGILFSFAILSAACGEDEKRKLVPKRSGEPASVQDEANNKDGLPPPENPIKPSEIATVNCSDVTPDTVIKLSWLRANSNIVSVPAGGVAQWVNDDAGSHSVTSEDPAGQFIGEKFDLGSLAPGQSICARFDYAGEFDYFCRLHSTQMHDDRLVVTPAP